MCLKHNCRRCTHSSIWLVITLLLLQEVTQVVGLLQCLRSWSSTLRKGERRPCPPARDEQCLYIHASDLTGRTIRSNRLLAAWLISSSATILTSREHFTVRSDSTDATVTSAPALRMTSMIVTASISSVPLPSGTSTVFVAEAAIVRPDREQTILSRCGCTRTPLNDALRYCSP